MPRTTYGVEWTEVDHKDRIITKRKEFATERERQRFCDRLVEKATFVDITAWTEPDAGYEPTDWTVDESEPHFFGSMV
jgi:hypothetical protein